MQGSIRHKLCLKFSKIDGAVRATILKNAIKNLKKLNQGPALRNGVHYTLA